MSTSPQSTDAARSLGVLVVDDEPLIRWALRRGLSAHGHRVVEAADGAQALRVLAADPGHFAVVLLDYRLPDCQDLTVLAEIRRIQPQVTVLMMTAYGDQAMRTGAAALGALHVIDKPFQVQECVSLVESLAGQEVLVPVRR